MIGKTGGMRNLQIPWMTNSSSKQNPLNTLNLGSKPVFDVINIASIDPGPCENLAKREERNSQTHGCED